MTNTSFNEICFWKKELINGMYEIDAPKFTWTDFHIIPDSRPFISIPNANYTLSQIPNSSKRINITEYLPGGQTFESRNGEWRFYIDHERWPSWCASHYALEEYFDGSIMLVLLADQKDIFEGRVKVSSYEANESYSNITITYDLDANPISNYENVLFRIRFIGAHNNILQENLMPYNDTPFFFGNANDGTDLHFVKWSPLIKKVTANTDYYAVYR